MTHSTVQFTAEGAKILIRRDRQVDEKSIPALRDLLGPAYDLGPPAAVGADCRVFLGRGISGKGGWHEFARILAQELVELECIEGWDIVVVARTAEEDDQLTEESDFGAIGEDLVSIDVDPERHLATYYVSSKEADEMDLLWEVDCRADAQADAIVHYLMAALGLLDDEDEDEEDEGEYDNDES